jgi:hypothetical protein
LDDREDPGDGGNAAERQLDQCRRLVGERRDEESQERGEAGG